MKRWISVLVLFAMVLPLTACAQREENAVPSADDLIAGITPGKVAEIDLQELTPGLPAFGVQLMQASLKEGENTLVSPLSVMYALAMTANGAKGETLSQMEAVLGMPVEQLNAYLHSYSKSLAEGAGTLRPANSIWITDDERFTVEQSFLQTVADYYDAGIYRVPFDDVTCRDINSWVKQKTDGMIPDILDHIPDDAVMYLINALAFDAKWQKTYEKSEVSSGTFHQEDGTARPVEMMHSEERFYLETANATGFIKKYEGGDYAFVALLPKDCTVSELVASLDGGELVQLLQNPEQTVVLAAIPKFETEYSVEMSEVLKSMGMVNAFRSDLADLSGLGHSAGGNLFIGRVLHKTFISVGEQGTKAGAATAVEVNDECSTVYLDAKTVTLDRPFVYMLIDTATCSPIFMGTLMDPQ